MSQDTNHTFGVNEEATAGAAAAGGFAAREGKRAQFAEGAAPQASRKTQLVVVAAAALLGVAAYLVFGGVGGGSPAGGTVATGGATTAPRSTGASAGVPAAGEAAEVSIPLAELSPKARFYEHAAAGKTVRFFALKSSDGTYRAALDACDTCYAAKKGYSQKGDQMVCNKCGMKFPSVRVNEESGGCNPVGLTREVRGDRLVIKAAELERGASFF